MPNHYKIKISWYDPYEKSFELIEKGSSESVAVSRAMKAWRKEEVPRKKLSDTIKIVLYKI